MKVVKTIEEVEGEGLLALIGRVVTLFCANYIYTGTLVGVNDTCVKLQDPYIVYQTGSFADKKWADAQKLPHPMWYVQTSAIESFGEMK